MHGFNFATLSLLSAVGFAGPLLMMGSGMRIPVIVGELAAGVVVGRSGFDVIDINNPVLEMFADIGFALVMFVAGSNVQVRDSGVRAAVPRALVRAIAVGAVAAVFGAILSRCFGTGHALIYAVLMGSSSAALMFPIVESLGLSGPQVVSVTAQVAIADTASIVLLPLVIDLSRAPRVTLGALLIAGCAFLVFQGLRMIERNGWRKRAHRFSGKHGLALELRVSLLILFLLSALAGVTHVSIMLAGFSLGLAVSGVGQPKRLARQLFAITEGFFAPLFFVRLGASLQVRELAAHPALIALGVGLGLGAILAHLVARLFGLPVTFAVLSAAQLGVPVAAVAIGESRHLLIPGEGAALILSALLTIASTTFAGQLADARSASAGSAHPQGCGNHRDLEGESSDGADPGGPGLVPPQPDHVDVGRVDGHE